MKNNKTEVNTNYFKIKGCVRNYNKLNKTYPDLNYNILNEQIINFKEVNPTHKLDDYDSLYYKFGPNLQIPPLFALARLRSDGKYKDIDYLNWMDNLYKLINEEMKDGITYSLAILGIKKESNNNKPSIITYGPHILVSKLINLDKLITYIEGQIDSKDISLESEDLDDEEEKRIIVFKYREISINKNIHKSVSNLDYTKKCEVDKGSNTSYKNVDILSKINNNKNIIRFLNVIPLSSNFSKFGVLINDKYTLSKEKIGSLYKYNDNIKIFIYDININSYKGIVFKNENEYITFTDTIIAKNEFNLIRQIGNSSIFIKDNLVQFIETKINSRQIELKKRALKRDTNYVIFDIECYLDKDNNFIPYACKWYTPKRSITYDVRDYKNWEEMISVFLIDIFVYCPDSTIYVHNLSSFDSLYLLKSLYKYFNTSPIIKDNKIISINVSKIINMNNKNKKIKLFFKDSLLLLPLALEKLINSFSIETKKLPFPYKFVREDNLNYIGPIPDYDYYKDNLNYEEYLSLSSNYSETKPWNLMDETKRYLHNDVKSLYEIIDKFSKEVYELERINITNTVSISSLALKTYLTNDYNKVKNPIYILRYKQYKEIKSAYFGGRVEIFKPYGENLYWYDVNSLYPFSMLKDIPIGIAIKSTDPNLDNYFGYCYVTVDIPENENNNLLPFRDENGNVYNPVGNWSGMYNSETLKESRRINGTKIIVHYGYKFERGKDVFNNYVTRYFDLKNKSKNNPGKRMIAKLMLNSLYGRFGLKYFTTINKIVSTSEAKEILLKYQVLENNIFDSENNLEYIRYSMEKSDILSDIDYDAYTDLIKNKENYNEDFIIRSLPISAMITGYAAIFMSQFLNIPGNKCYYSDTDGIVLEKPLDPKYVGNEIGKFKFEGHISKGYFISPKLYCLILNNGEIVIKSKGVPKNYLTEKDFEGFLYGIEKNISVHRFVKKISESTVSYRNLNYKISPQILKREPIFDNGLIIDTKPLKVKDGKLLIIDKIKREYNLVPYTPNKYALIIS